MNERGAAPRGYADYRDAIGDLEERLGTYCSYCERRMPSGLAVEHMAPKSLPGRELDWDNFLLGCGICNSIKGDKDIADGEVLWPDRHNTILALAYLPGGFVEAEKNLNSDLRRRAQVLIDLTVEPARSERVATANENGRALGTKGRGLDHGRKLSFPFRDDR